MWICQKCYKEIDDNFDKCWNCFDPTTLDKEVEKQVENERNVINDARGVILSNIILPIVAILSFYLPIVGIIIFFYDLKSKPIRAKICGGLALLSFIINYVIPFLN